MANAFYAPMAKASQYAAPDISKLLYEGIGNLPQDYYQGQKSAQELALSQSLPQGLTPYWSRDPRTGQPVFDVYRYANDQARIGGPAQAAPFVNALMGAQYGAQQSQALAGIAGLPSPDGGLPTGWAPPGQSQPPQPPPRSPPQTAGPQSNILPGPQSSTAQPPEPSGQIDYLDGIAQEHYRDDASGATAKVAAALKVTPEQILSPLQIKRAKELYAGMDPDGRVLIRPASSRPDTDPASGPQPTFGPSEDVSPVPRATSALERGVNGTPGPAPESPVGGAGPGVVTPQGITPRSVPTTTFTPAGANVRTAGGPLGQPAAPPAQPAPVAGAGGRLIDVPLPGVPREVESLRLKAAAAAIEAARAGLNPNQQMGKGMETGASALAKQYADAYESKLKALYEANKLTPEAVDAYRGLTGLVAAHKSALEQGQERGKSNAKMAENIDTLGDRSRQDIKHLEDADRLIDQTGSYLGPFHNLVQQFQEARWMLGGDRMAGTSNQILIKEFANAELAAIRDLGNSGLGRILQREVESVQRTIMNMGQTPETARELVEIAIRTRKMQMKAQDLLRENNGVVDETYRRRLSEFYDKNPLITPAEMEDRRLIAPPRLRNRTPEEYQRLSIQPGEPVRMWSEKDNSWKIRNAPPLNP